MRALPPGTKWSDRRRRATSGALLAHHRVAPRDHDDLAMLVERPVQEGHDAPLRPRARLALVDHFGLGVDRVAVEHRLRELDLLETEIAHGCDERGLADPDPTC